MSGLNDKDRELLYRLKIEKLCKRSDIQNRTSKYTDVYLLMLRKEDKKDLKLYRFIRDEIDILKQYATIAVKYNNVTEITKSGYNGNKAYISIESLEFKHKNVDIITKFEKLCKKNNSNVYRILEQINRCEFPFMKHDNNEHIVMKHDNINNNDKHSSLKNDNNEHIVMKHDNNNNNDKHSSLNNDNTERIVMKYDNSNNNDKHSSLKNIIIDEEEYKQSV